MSADVAVKFIIIWVKAKLTFFELRRSGAMCYELNKHGNIEKFLLMMR